MTQEQMRNLNTIVETYGNDAQEDMAIEECSELIKAILKFRRSDEKTAEMRDAVIGRNRRCTDHAYAVGNCL